MPSKYNLSSSTVQNRYLGSGGFKGVDFTSSPSFASPDRFSDAKNVYIDYRSGLGACVETFPGYRIPLEFGVQKALTSTSFTEVEIHGMVLWHVNGSATLMSVTIENEDVVAIHAGKRLYIVPTRSIDGKLYSDNRKQWITFPTTPEYGGNATYRATFEDGTESVFCCVASGDDTDTKGFYEFVERYNFLPDHPCKMFAEDGDLFILAEEGYFRVRLKSGSFITGTTTTGTTTTETKSHYLFHAEHIVNKIDREYAPGKFETVWGWGSSYTPTTYVNNEAYEQANFLNDSFVEEFTRLEVNESEEESEALKVVTLNCSCFPSSKIYFSYWFPDGAGTPTFSGSSIRVDFGEDKVFDGADPIKGQAREDFSVEFYYQGEPVNEDLVQKYGDEEKWRIPFDEIRFSQVYAINKETGAFTDSEFKKIIGANKTVRISVDGQTDVPSAVVDEFDGKPAEAILGCKVVEHHDGRIFFAGNPKLPNVVFYTQRNLNGKNEPTYVGAQNYFRVGGEGTPVKSMISTSSALIIFKDAGRYQTESSIFYANGVTTETDIVPRVYTVTQGAIGVGCTSEAINFADDICFASERGIFGLNKLQTNLERSVQSRSKLIDGRLVSEDPAVLMTEWEGYLCVYCKSGHMYLADSRQLSGEGYEWFYVDKIGYYKNESIRRYVDPTAIGKTIYDAGGKEIGIASYGSSVGTVKTGFFHQTVIGADGVEKEIKVPCRYIEHSVENSESEYVVLKNYDERVGGMFNPATTMLAVGDSIWFGSKGRLIVLNSDLRGIANGADDEGIDPMRLRSKWYTFAGRAIESYVTTYYDDAGIPNLAKSTVNRSTIVDIKTMPGSAFKVSVYTERDKWMSPIQSSSAVPDFGDADFEASTFGGDFHTTVMLREHTNGWSRKMYRVYSDEYSKPFGIHRISYQFRVAGRIKDL